MKKIITLATLCLSLACNSTYTPIERNYNPSTEPHAANPALYSVRNSDTSKPLDAIGNFLYDFREEVLWGIPISDYVNLVGSIGKDEEGETEYSAGISISF